MKFVTAYILRFSGAYQVFPGEAGGKKPHFWGIKKASKMTTTRHQNGYEETFEMTIATLQRNARAQLERVSHARLSHSEFGHSKPSRSEPPNSHYY